MIRTITIEREYGAGGGVIAEKLAQRLGWKLWDQELTCEIARVAKVDQNVVERMDERCDSLFYRLMKVFMRGSMEKSLPVRNMGHFDADSMVEFMQRVISSAASEGNSVIVGRGAPFLLRDRPDTFHVFIYAPFEEKIHRLMHAGKTEDEAHDEIESIDRQRVIFVKRYYGMDWPTRDLYHMMINSKVGDDVVIDSILGEIARLDAVSARPLARTR
ncbi:MAG TPA: cytidylate kinase-like family protein [Bryobacteraceae bacterium]|nr:cytidylate kinase-like family protein [Bryobacteraceae bacterium]